MNMKEFNEDTLKISIIREKQRKLKSVIDTISGSGFVISTLSDKVELSSNSFDPIETIHNKNRLIGEIKDSLEVFYNAQNKVVVNLCKQIVKGAENGGDSKADTVS